MSKKIELDEYIKKFKARKRLRNYIIGAVLLIVLGVVYMFSQKSKGTELSTGQWGFAEAQRGDLSITITEKGTMHPEKESPIVPQTYGEVEWLIEKGNLVKKDEVLVKLKSDDKEQRLESNQNELEQIISDIAVNEEQLEGKKINWKNKLADAERNFEKKQEDLRKFLEVDDIRTSETKQFQIRQKDIALEKSWIEYDGIQTWISEGFYSQNQLNDAKLKWENAKRDFENAKQDFIAYRDYERPDKLRALMVDVEKSSDTIRTVTLQNMRENNEHNERIRRYRQKKERCEEKIKENTQQIEDSRMRAPQDGMVVYKKIRWWDREVQVGDRVYQGMTLMSIPSFSRMIAKINVQEFDIHKVSKGTSCTIVLDANPDATYTGKITEIATLGSTDRVTKNNVFESTVLLMEMDEAIKPGMGCRVTALIKDLKDVIYIPIEAVFNNEGKEVVYVKRDGKAWEKREVEVGDNNDSHVVIVSGLAPEEQVLLIDPTKEGFDFEETETEKKGETKGSDILSKASSSRIYASSQKTKRSISKAAVLDVTPKVVSEQAKPLVKASDEKKESANKKKPVQTKKISMNHGKGNSKPRR